MGFITNEDIERFANFDDENIENQIKTPNAVRRPNVPTKEPWRFNPDTKSYRKAKTAERLMFIDPHSIYQMAKRCDSRGLKIHLNALIKKAENITKRVKIDCPYCTDKVKNSATHYALYVGFGGINFPFKFSCKRHLHNLENDIHEKENIYGITFSIFASMDNQQDQKYLCDIFKKHIFRLKSHMSDEEYYDFFFKD